MEEFRQVIPKGMEARIENGEVIYTPIEEIKCPFEVGDVVVHEGGGLYLFEGVNENGNILRKVSYNSLSNEFENRGFKAYSEAKKGKYTKATPEQVDLFNQKCLENNVWFDRLNKKWIELKEGGIYKCDVIGTSAVFIFDRVSSDGIFSKASIFKSGCGFIGSECPVYNILKEFKNISEATEEQKQQLFYALAKEGKQWNAEKKCVEDLKWKPKEGELYWFANSMYIIIPENKSTDFIEKGRCEKRFEAGNCFKTREECEKYAEYMRECSLNYKP